MLNRRQLLGKNGEVIAATYLQKRGYKIIGKNYHCKFGEIDVIAFDGDCLVFIEVKTRSSTSFGTPAAAVDFRKQKQISKAAHAYLRDKQMMDCNTRFDVVGITVQNKKPPKVELFTNAFDFCI